jgi:alpha-beta hydrolase superfamily lysophospholipase
MMMSIDRRAAAAALTLALVLAAGTPPARAQAAAACPGALDAVATCYRGADANGARYWIAIPRHWNRTLVVHAHGGPRMSHAANDDNREDLERFAVTVRQGYAWAGSAYRRPGYGVLLAAEDTDNLRALFVRRFGTPAHVFLHGQSWGGNVAAMVAERHARAPDGKPYYDGAVLTSGMLAGGTLNYLHRADLRAVYQYYCGNHPRPDEPSYPVWMGLPPGTALTAQELARRVDDCLGLDRPAAQRSALQQRRLANILAVVPVPERTLQSHLNWATFTFRDLVARIGGNPFDNRHVVYRGSDDDAALNRGVQRFDADPAAVARLAAESDPAGTIGIPVLTMHAIDDPTALVEYETEYASRVAAAGHADLLVQTFTREHEHSRLSDAEYAGVFDSLAAWVDGGRRPTPATVAEACTREAGRFEGGCHFDAAYRPAALFTRVAPRR